MVGYLKILLLLLPFGLTVQWAKANTAPCLQLSGIVEDYVSHKPLSGRFSIKTSIGRQEVGRSHTQTGRFSIEVTCQSQYLLIECDGYRPRQLYLNMSTNEVSLQNIHVIIPLIAVDKQGNDKPYLQTEQRHFEQRRSGQITNQIQRNVFTISDALTGKVLSAKSCFVFTNTGERRCIDSDSNGELRIDFDRKDIIAVEITAAGYQNYSGNLIIDAINGQELKHTIRLTRELVLLSVKLANSDHVCSLKSLSGVQWQTLTSFPGKPDIWVASDLHDQRYILEIRDKKGSTKSQKQIAMQRGLNVIIDPDIIVAGLNTPEAVPDEPLTDGKILPVIYFEQGRYEMSLESRKILRQIATYLLGHPSQQLQITGYTDSEGDEKLNRLLSVNRAKVVGNFLSMQGVSDQQLLITGVGSKHLAAPSDTEENKAKNRRVQLKLKTN